jgi:hypothetical protein
LKKVGWNGWNKQLFELPERFPCMKGAAFFIFLVTSLMSSSQQYMRYMEKGKSKSFYWDYHPAEHPTKQPAKVSREFIYHIITPGKDSLLETAITYNLIGQAVEKRTYAIPSKEGLVYLDSLFYTKNGLLKKWQRFNVLGSGIFWKKDTSLIYYLYDENGREKYRREWLHDYLDTDYVTEYDDHGRIHIRKWFNGEVEQRQEIHYYSNSGIEDSMQVLILDKWAYTTIFQYDAVQHIRTAWLRSDKSTWLRSRFQLRPDTQLSKLLINNFPSWNGAKEYDMEIEYVYNNDGSIHECIYRLDGKRRFSKKHIYFVHDDKSR